MGMLAVLGADQTALGLSRQFLIHDSKHLVLIVPESPSLQRALHPTVFVAGERLDSGDERLLPVGPALSLMVILSTGQVHQRAAFSMLLTTQQCSTLNCRFYSVMRGCAVQLC